MSGQPLTKRQLDDKSLLTPDGAKRTRSEPAETKSGSGSGTESDSDSESEAASEPEPESMTGVPEEDVKALCRYGRNTAGIYYQDEENSDADDAEDDDADINRVVAKYSGLENWDHENLDPRMRKVMHRAMTWDPGEFTETVEVAAGKTPTAMFGPPGTNPLDYASVVAFKLWAESMGMFDGYGILFEMFEDVLCPVPDKF